MPSPGGSPQKTPNQPAEDILAVARALALLHARMDHETEIADSPGNFHARRQHKRLLRRIRQMIRAAIYARFSSDLQNDKSVDDQVAFCREVASREGMTVVTVFEDRAVSASSSINRAGFIAMMRSAEAKLFDIIVAEDMDRIFRDQGDYHAARKRLDFLGIGIHTASGKISRLEGSLRALMGEWYRGRHSRRPSRRRPRLWRSRRQRFAWRARRRRGRGRDRAANLFGVHRRPHPAGDRSGAQCRPHQAAARHQMERLEDPATASASRARTQRPLTGPAKPRSCVSLMRRSGARPRRSRPGGAMLALRNRARRSVRCRDCCVADHAAAAWRRSA
jgi:DNA invertase Pin-like site-specific DNA recombinase